MSSADAIDVSIETASAISRSARSDRNHSEISTQSAGRCGTDRLRIDYDVGPGALRLTLGL